MGGKMISRGGGAYRDYLQILRRIFQKEGALCYSLYLSFGSPFRRKIFQLIKIYTIRLFCARGKITSVGPGGCVIETDSGEIDARISSQLAIEFGKERVPFC
jgi:hypothetical protein